MSSGLYRLSDQAWQTIEPRLPKNRPGRKKLDDRTMISAIIHMLKTGTPWERSPSCYGNGATIYKRWVAWGRSGTWAQIVDALTDDEWACETALIDEDYIAFHGVILNAATARGPLPLASRTARPGARRARSGQADKKGVGRTRGKKVMRPVSLREAARISPR